MKKTIIAAGAVAMALSVAGCNLGPVTTGSAGSTTIKVGNIWAASHPMTQAVNEVFKKQIEEKTNGAIMVEAHQDNDRGNEADLWSSVREGTIEVVVIGSVMNQEYPIMLISDWPWLYRDAEHAKMVWTGEISEEVSASFNEKFPAVEMLAWGPNSARTFTSNRQLSSPSDFAGQKFRMPSNPVHVGLAENLGASSQVIPLGELFSALETGIVDGQDNGMVTVRSEGLYEVQKYVYETNHIIATMEIIANSEWMEKLTPEQQTIVRDAAKETSVVAWDKYIASIDEDRAFLQSEGLTVTAPSEQDRSKLVEMTQPVTNKLLADNPDWAPQLVEKITNVK